MPSEVRRAERIVLPGVGAFADCRRGLAARARHGRSALRRGGDASAAGPSSASASACSSWPNAAASSRRVEGLGWIAGEVVRDRARRDPTLKIPHMGWNELDAAAQAASGARRASPPAPMPISCTAIASPAASGATCWPTVDYGGAIVAVVGRDNLVGTQFHPGEEPGDRACASSPISCAGGREPRRARRRRAVEELESLRRHRSRRSLRRGRGGDRRRRRLRLAQARRRATSWRIIGAACCSCPSARLFVGAARRHHLRLGAARRARRATTRRRPSRRS